MHASRSAGLGAPRTQPVQCWWERARARSLRGMCAPGVAGMHAARESCMHSRPDDALHAHHACSPSVRRQGGDGIWRTRTDAGRRYRAVGCSVRVVHRPAATCRAMRRAVSGSDARAVMTSSTARMEPTTSLNKHVQALALALACMWTKGIFIDKGDEIYTSRHMQQRPAS